VSAERSDREAVTNELNTARLADNLRRANLPHIKLLGSWQGVEETSWLLFDPEVALYIAKWFGQEAILELTPSPRQAVLVDVISGKRQKLGAFVEVSESAARFCDGWECRRDDWTYRPDTDQWFVVQ